MSRHWLLLLSVLNNINDLWILLIFTLNYSLLFKPVPGPTALRVLGVSLPQHIWFKWSLSCHRTLQKPDNDLSISIRCCRSREASKTCRNRTEKQLNNLWGFQITPGPHKFFLKNVSIFYLLHIFGLSLCRILVKAISQECLEQISSNLAKGPFGLKDELIWSWWLKVVGQGHCELIKHIFGHYSTIIITWWSLLWWLFYTNIYQDKLIMWKYFISEKSSSVWPPRHKITKKHLKCKIAMIPLNDVMLIIAFDRYFSFLINSKPNVCR